MLSGRGLCDGLIPCSKEFYGCLSVCECCVLSGRGLCDGLIPCPEEFYEYLSFMSVVCCQVEFSAMG